MLIGSDLIWRMRVPGLFEHVMMLTSAAARAAVAHDRRLLISPPVKSRFDIDRLGVDGAIVVDGAAGDSQLALFAQEDIPVVTLERHPDHPEHRFHVNADNNASMNVLLDHLAAAGGERIALLIPDWNGIAWMTESLQAYSDWCGRRRRQPIVELSSPIDVPEATFEQSLRLLRHEHRPDAILSVSEGIQGGVLRAARELDLSVPDDLLVACYNDSTTAKLADPPITALDLNSDQQGRLAVELLIELIEKKDAPAAPLIVPTTLNVRASTSRPADSKK